MARPKLPISEKKTYQYTALLSEELVESFMKFIYGRNVSNMIELIVEDYVKNVSEIKLENFIGGIKGKKSEKIKLYFPKDIACKIEKRRNLEKRNKSEFIRYVLNLWIIKQNNKIQ